MHKLLFVSINSAWTHSNLALYYLREMIRDLPYQIAMEEFTLKTQPLEALEIINLHQPDFICFSVYIWNRIYLQKLIPELKKLFPDTKLILGGPEAMNEDLLSTTSRYDIIIQGSGEAIFRKLAAEEFEERGIIHSELQTPLYAIPFPYHPSDREILQDRLVYYECSRGCPYSCVYCLSANDLRNEIRFDVTVKEDVLRLHKELDALVALSPRTIKFVDRSFNLYPKLAHAIWKYIIDLDCTCDFHFEIYPDLLKESDLKILEKAPPGRIRFEIGIQSTNDSVMKQVKRNSHWKKIQPILKELRKRSSVRIHTDLICGLPSEDKKSLLASINAVAATFPHEIQLGMLKILPDTAMYTIAQDSGYLWLDHPPYQVIATDTLSFEDICELEKLAHAFNLYWNKGEFCQLFALLMQDYEAVFIFERIVKMHSERSFPYHSMEQKKRFKLIRDMILEYYPAQQYQQAYRQDWKNMSFRGEVDL